MKDEQRLRIEKQLKDIFIDTKAIMDRLEMVFHVLEEEQTEAEDIEKTWKQTEPRPDDW